MTGILLLENTMTKEIELTKGMVALVDDDMYDYLMQWSWYVQKGWDTYYAVRREDGKTILMHIVVSRASSDLFVDHINGNGLDNRRENLRVCTNAENGRNRKKQTNNTSGFVGVCRIKKSGRYGTKIGIDGKYLYLGSYEDAAEAARVRDEAAIKYHEEFAKLNFE